MRAYHKENRSGQEKNFEKTIPQERIYSYNSL